jgi:hypothetical protein
MTYFKTRGRPIVDVFDPRRIEAAIESPTWWREQLGAVADRAPSVDLGAECAGRGTNPRDVSGFVFEVGRADASEIVDLHGVTGLALGKSVEVRLPQPAEVVDIGLAHDGTPPKVVAYAGKRPVARAAAGPSARHIENIRLVGPGLDRLVIDNAEGAVLNYIRCELAAERPASSRH